STEQANGFASAAQFIRETSPKADYLARYLVVPGFHTHAIWLEAQTPVAPAEQTLLVVCDRPEGVPLELRRYYNDQEFRRVLRGIRRISGLDPGSAMRAR